MCYKITCMKCGLKTWGGCGKHLDGLFAGSSLKDICKCDISKYDSVMKYIK